MASKPRQPIRNTVESLVKWHVGHGSNIIDIINKVTDRFGYSKSVYRISEYISKWSKELGKVPAVSRLKKLTDKQRAQLIQFGYVKGYKRVIMDVTWTSEKQEGIVTQGWAVDIPDNLSPKEEQQVIFNVLAARFAKEYEGVIKTMADLAKIIISVKQRKEE